MNRGLSHLDITQIFVDVDDFCQVFEPLLAGGSPGNVVALLHQVR